jgi:GNAT superfamily N-acetyltransferase
VRRDLGDGYELDDDPARVDLVAVHRFLSEEAYWSLGRSYGEQEAFVRDALRVVGLYRDGRQVGFCRASATTGRQLIYLADVYVLPECRGRGLGVELVREMVENGPHAGCRWLLQTEDAHGLYRKLGFDTPGPRLMERPARP